MPAWCIVQSSERWAQAVRSVWAAAVAAPLQPVSEGLLPMVLEKGGGAVLGVQRHLWRRCSGDPPQSCKQLPWDEEVGRTRNPSASAL